MCLECVELNERSGNAKFLIYLRNTYRSIFSFVLCYHSSQVLFLFDSNEDKGEKSQEEEEEEEAKQFKYL